MIVKKWEQGIKELLRLLTFVVNTITQVAACMMVETSQNLVCFSQVLLFVYDLSHSVILANLVE